MYHLIKGRLTMGSLDIERIKELMEKHKYTPKEALKYELDKAGISINRVKSIFLTARQISDREYCQICEEIICDLGV